LLAQDVDQLWAEAVEAYEAGEDWHTVPAEIVAAEQSDRQVQLEDSEPWFGKLRAALTDPDMFSSEVWHARDEYVDGQPTGGIVIRAGAVHSLLGIVLGVDTPRQSVIDVERVQKVLRGIGFKKVRPNGKWMGGTYAYDLRREMVPHLWPAIEAARSSVKFPKPVTDDSTTA
jgi:hypothetical protein